MFNNEITKRALNIKWKAFFIIFKGLSVLRNCRRPESGPLLTSNALCLVHCASPLSPLAFLLHVYYDLLSKLFPQTKAFEKCTAGNLIRHPLILYQLVKVALFLSFNFIFKCTLNRLLFLCRMQCSIDDSSTVI